MRNTPLTAVSLLALALASCAPSGYYDSNGVYHSYGKSDTYRTNSPRDNAPPPGGYPADQGNNAPQNYNYNSNSTYVQTSPASTTTIIYDRPGTYDYNGYYISSDSGPEIPGRYFPPHGMCRVWFTDRPANQEPPVESCEGIRSRVPQGAYIVYGG